MTRSTATYLLEGTLLAVQPLSVTPPSLSKATKAGDPKPIPKMVIYSNGESVLVPYLPATTIRGRLRRCARDAAREALIEKTGNPKPWKLEDHFFNTIGGIKGKEKETKRTVIQDQAIRTRNPLVSLFGAGQPFIPGLLAIGNALAKEGTTAVLLGDGVRTDDLMRDRQQTKFLEESELERYIAKAEGNRDRKAINDSIKALKTSLRKLDGEQKAAAQEQLKALENQLGDAEKAFGAVSLQMPLSGWEAIPQGTELSQTMRLYRASDIELGLLLEALDTFSFDPIMGAHSNVGCGMVGMQYTIKQVDRKTVTALGTITVMPHEGLQIHESGDTLKNARLAWKEASMGDELDFNALALSADEEGDEE